jgi:Glycosyltransferases, probably involved in cell wall biogenesis
MKLQVITITYNNDLELEHTLSTLSGYQVLVINGGDQGRDLCAKFDVRAVHERDRGISDAFNKGYNNALGDYVMYLNSGDLLIDRDYPRLAAEFLDRNPNVDYVHADILFADQNAGKIRLKPSKNIGRGMVFLHPTLVIRKSVFEAIGVFKEEYRVAMDYEWGVRLVKSGFKGHHFDRVVVEMDGGGISSTQEESAIRECRKALIENNMSLGVHLCFVQRLLLFKLRRLAPKRFLSLLKRTLRK